MKQPKADDARLTLPLDASQPEAMIATCKEQVAIVQQCQDYPNEMEVQMRATATLASADAGSSKKHRYYRHQTNGPVVYQPYGAWQAPAGVRRRGPPWAMPNECFNDEGYGRWSPCGGRDH